MERETPVEADNGNVGGVMVSEDAPVDDPSK